MKTKSVTLAALAVSQLIGLAALAQSSSSATSANMNTAPGAAAAPAGGDAQSAPAANTAGLAGTSVAEAPAKPKVNVSYLGIMYGPGLSNELDGKTYGVYAYAMASVLKGMRNNRVPINDFAWATFYEVRKGTNEGGGGGSQTPTLPVAVSMSTTARF